MTELTTSTKDNILIAKQQANDSYPLFELAPIPRDLVQLASHSIPSHSARYTRLTG